MTYDLLRITHYLITSQLLPIPFYPLAITSYLSSYLLPITYRLSFVTSCLLPITDCLLPITYYHSHQTYHLLPIAYDRVPIIYDLLPITCV